MPYHFFVYITATGRREDGHEAEPPGPPSRSCRRAYSPAALLCVVAMSSFHDVLPCAFGNLLGNGSENVIREGTVMSALLTGLCMRFTDKLADVMVPASVKKYL